MKQSHILMCFTGINKADFKNLSDPKSDVYVEKFAGTAFGVVVTGYNGVSRLIFTITVWSTIWDSNPLPQLGRLICYQYTNGAYARAR